MSASSTVRPAARRPLMFVLLLGGAALLAMARGGPDAAPASAPAETSAAALLQAWRHTIHPRYAPFLRARDPDSADRWTLVVDAPLDPDDPASAYAIVLHTAQVDRMRRLADALVATAAAGPADAAAAPALKAYVAALRREAAGGAAAPPYESRPDRAARGAADQQPARRALLHDAIAADIAVSIARRLALDAARRGAADAPPGAQADAIADALLVASDLDEGRARLPGRFVQAALDERPDAPLIGSVAFACRLAPLAEHDRRVASAARQADALADRAQAALAAYAGANAAACGSARAAPAAGRGSAP